MEEEHTTKVRISSGVRQMSEQEWAQFQYDEALQKMNAEPTPENIAAFTAANKKLFEVQDAYRIAARLLLERAVNLGRAIRG